nr:hypothetical protein [Tanacetum cinerariifolium]
MLSRISFHVLIRQGDQTPSPRDESSDSEFEAEEADDELEVEEVGVEPEVEEAGVEPEVEEAGDKPEAEGADMELEAEELDGKSSTTRNPLFIGSLAPWALRRDLEALRRQERIREAESETSRTEIAFLGSEAKIEKMERFYLEMVRKGAVPKPPSDDEGSESSKKTSKKSDGDEGPSDPRGSLKSGGTGGNADGTGVRGTRPTVPKLAGCTYATFIKCDPLPFI